MSHLKKLLLFKINLSQEKNKIFIFLRTFVFIFFLTSQFSPFRFRNQSLWRKTIKSIKMIFYYSNLHVMEKKSTWSNLYLFSLIWGGKKLIIFFPFYLYQERLVRLLKINIIFNPNLLKWFSEQQRKLNNIRKKYK